MSARIVITGLGVISPLGIGHDVFWEGLLAGRSGISELTSFDTSEYAIKRGGEVRGFDPQRYMAAATAERLGRGAQFAVAAARMALEDARLAAEDLPRDRVGVCLGTTVAESQAVEQCTEIGFREGLAAVEPGLFRQCPGYNMPASVAAEFGLGGPNMLLPTACAAGNYAIGYAFDLLRRGRAEIMLAGGVDPFSQNAFTGFHKLNSMAKDVPRPYSAGREGMMVSEGAGLLVLESLERASERHATIYAEILGYGLSCDAHHMTAPHPEGRGALRAMEQAIQRAGLAPEDLDYINGHGTGTLLNDRIETQAVKRLLGERAYQVPISSIKSMLGHTLGAASALEAITCALAVKHGIIPPTANYQAPDPDCDLDYVPHVARQAPLRVVMSNAYAFGGNNAALIIGRVG